MLGRLVAEGVRYGHDFALVRIAIPLGCAEEMASLMASALRDPDVLVQWEADELLALLPSTDRAGASRAAARLLEAAGTTPVAVGAAHWLGDTPRDLLARAMPRR
jgi:PleD family two-component response regulator